MRAAAAVLLVLAGTIAALALAAPSHAASGGATTHGWTAFASAKPRPAGTLSGLRMCMLEQFDQSTSECRVDSRAVPLLSTGMGCSATLRARKATLVTASMTYQGVAEAKLNIRVPRRGLYSLYLTLYTPTTLLPAGSYGCRFQLGRRAVAGRIRSGGPANPVVGTAVCNTSDTSAPGASGCNADASVVPLTGDSITCSALFANQKGREATIEVVQTVEGQATVLQRIGGMVPLPLVELYLAYSPPGGPAPGTYSCRYIVDGQVAAEKPFTIA
jgi:hypothetical protein